jgi:uncharacterized ParB-like nuclease family protein
MTLLSKIRHSLSRNLLCAGLAMLGSASEAQTPWLGSERVDGEARFLYGNQIRRYNLDKKKWVAARKLPRSGATAMTGDAAGAYVAYGPKIYRYGANFAKEKSFATASSDIQSLFLDGDLLIAVHSTGLYSRVTVYNRHTGALLSTEETYVDSLYGASHAPGSNRIFGRTEGVSPADIVGTSYSDTGLVANTQGSPYHGDFPSATKTWVFPNETRVVDSSGTVYGTEGLPYAGSLAGAVTDIDFNGDVPVVLRGSEVIAFTNTLVEAGRASAGTTTGAELYVAGGNALVFSPASSAKTNPTVKVVPLSSLNAPEPGTPVVPAGLPYTIDDAFPDKDGNLLLFSKAQMSLFRWSPAERRYTASYPLVGTPKFAAYSKTSNAAYFAYDSGLVRKMDLSAETPAEAPLFNLPATPGGLSTAGEFVFSHDYSGAWGTHYYHSPDGTLIDSADWNYYSRVWEWDPVKRRTYFFRDSQSPSDLHWESISATGQITGEGETPYHGDFTVTPPIRVNGDGSRVVIGSGVVFETTGMTKSLNLANGFTDAAWWGSTLYTMRLINGITQVQSWQGSQLLAGPIVRQFSGTPQRIFATSAGLVVIVLQDGVPRFILLNEELATLYMSPVKPAAPSNLLVTARDEDSVTLQWQDLSNNEESFQIEYRIGSGNWVTGATVPTGVTSATVEGLEKGTIHEFRVSAVTGPLVSEPSATITGRTISGPNEPTGEPYSLAVTRIFNNRITLEWKDNATNETGFRILRTTATEIIPVVLTAPANATSFTDTGLTPNTTYFYRLQVVNGLIEGELSAQVSGRTLFSATTPASPSGLVATAPSSTLVNVKWNDNSTNEDGFIIERSSNPATTWTEVGRVDYNVKNYGDANVLPNTAYSYRVRAWNTTGASSNATTTIITPKLGGEFAGHAVRAGNSYYFAFTGPHRIERYDLAARQWLTPVSLQAAATALWADTAGIYVAEDRTVIRFSPDGSARTVLANSESTVSALFTLDNTLVFQNGNNKTSLDKTTGTILASFSSYYSAGSGFSISPTTRRAFYRTTGISPSDIGFVEIGTDGKLVKYAESPYHGDYPHATRTFVFPNGARVADDSGTVYDTEGLAYNNSLGGAFTDLSFHGIDVPIVLRNNKLVSYSNNLLEAGSFTLPAAGLRVAVEGTDAIVFTPDGASLRGLSVQMVPLSQLAAPQPGAPVDPRGLAYTPDDVFIDKNGDVLLFSKSQLSLFRWSPSQTSYLPTLPLLGAPTVAAYSAENHSAYFAYASQVVRKMDLAAAAPVESPLFNLPASPTGLTAAGEFLYVVANGIKTFTPAGTQLTNDSGTYYSSSHNTWDPVNRRVYHFRDGVSPNDLHFDTVGVTGQITGTGETPYHGDFATTKPIRVSPDGTQVVIGSGVVFTANGLTKLASLANTFTDAAWHGGRLVTVRLINGVSQLQTWNGAQFTLGTDVRQVSGTPLRLFPLDATRLLLITQVGGVPRFTILNTTLEPTYVSPTKPLQPWGLTITGRSDSSVGLAWTDASDNEDGFLVEYRIGTGAWVSGGTLPANATSATVTGLASGTLHEFRVTAFSGDLKSTPSASMTALTLTSPDQPVGEPYGLRITRVFHDGITLEWSDNATNETAFALLRSTTAAGDPIPITAPANTTSYTVTGLSPSTTHYFRVQAMNGSTGGDLSAQVSATTLSSNSVPTMSTKLTVTGKTATSVSLTWQDNASNEENFAVERSSSPAATWTTVATLGYNQTAYTDTTLTPNTAYSYRVRAINTGGNSISSVVTVTTSKLGGDFASLSIRTGDTYYFAFTGPDRIERYDLATRQWLAPVALQATATALWADESFIYVAEDRAVIRFALDGSGRTPVGNGESTVKALFTVKDVLAFGPSSGQITSLNKHSGLFLATFDSGWYGMGGISTATSLNRMFYRTTGSSPSDIGYAEIGTDGKLVKSGQSPYHGDYPSATRTFMFPDSARVADDSGTVYSTDSLTYTNSLGGSFTDLSFYGSNIPIVLRDNKLLSYTNTLLEAGSYTLAANGLRVAVAGDDAIVFTADGTTTRGLRVDTVPLSLLPAPTPGQPVDARGLAFTPGETFLDRDGNLLLLSKAHLSLFRWSVSNHQFLPTIPLAGSPTHAAYSKTNHCVYLAYATQVIRKIDLSVATPVETPLFNLPSTPRGLATAGEFIFSDDDSGAWDTHYYHSANGTLIDSAEWNRYSRAWEWDPVKRRMYFFRDDTSPNDLHWESIDATGKINGEGETPYHGDFTIATPIRVSPDGTRIVIGSGALFETTGMTRLTTLANTFVDAAWNGAELLTIRASGSQTQLQRWTGASYTATGTPALFTGTPLRLMPLDGGQFLLITLDRGMPRFQLLDATLNVIYDYIPDAPHVTGTAPAATEEPPTSEGNAVASASSAVAPAFAIHQCLKMEDGGFLIEFNAEAGHSYRVEYSDDMRVWKTSPAPIVGAGTQVQWVDRGPPWTESHPSSKTSRFYRVVEE